MSFLGLIGDWITTIASSPNGPAGPWAGAGPLSPTGLGGGTGGLGGPGGPGGPDNPDGPDGPDEPKKRKTTLRDLWESGKKALDELGDTAKEVTDIATSDDRTDDENIAFDAGKTTPDGVLVGNAPGSGIAKTAFDAGKAGYTGMKTAQKYNKRKTNVLDSIGHDSKDGTPDTSGSDPSGDDD